MYNETQKNDWSEIRGKIKARFGKLTDENIDSMKGSLDQLSSRLQSAYGYAKEQADKESTSFTTSLRDVKEPEKHQTSETEKRSGVEEAKTPFGQGSKKVA
jgi:uncharacterized protein YjbJ (UPF0337 family)